MHDSFINLHDKWSKIFKRKSADFQWCLLKDSSHITIIRREREKERKREGRRGGKGDKKNRAEMCLEGDENFYLAFTSRFRAAERPCPKEGRFNIRLWRLCFTVWDTHSAPFRPINPHSAFNLRVFASYSPPRLPSRSLPSLRSPRRRGSVAMATPGVPAPNRRAPTPRRRRPYEDEKDDNNWWGRGRRVPLERCAGVLHGGWIGGFVMESAGWGDWERGEG